MSTLYDLVIIGAGPAGAAAAVYAARKHLKAAFVAPEWGGQSVVSPEIQNWVGTVAISGNELAENLKKHVEAYAGEFVEVKYKELVSGMTRNDDGTFTLTTKKGLKLQARAVLIASGASRRRLAVPGADEFEHKGLTYCASCDGPLFADMDVAVIGGGNAAFETAAQLLAYAKSVTLLHHSPAFKADEVTREKVLAHENMKALVNAEPTEVMGEKFVTGLRYKDRISGEEKMLPVSGIFVEIGMLPNTGFAEGLVELDDYKRITIDPLTQATSVAGVWAAGDCANVKYHQNNIAAGDGVKALEDAYLWLKAR